MTAEWAAATKEKSKAWTREGSDAPIALDPMSVKR